MTYFSADSPMEDEQAHLYPGGFLNEWNMSGFSPYKLELKGNSIVMLLRNLNPLQGLCNGTRLIIKQF